jgi:hypothetical protein
MSASLDAETPPVKVRWWNRLPNLWNRLPTLQTAAFVIGWIVGVPAGALVANAWGVWSEVASNKARLAEYTQLIAEVKAVTIRQDALEKISETETADRSISRQSFNTRLTKVEASIAPSIVTSELLNSHTNHLGEIDGRWQTTDRALQAEQVLRASQIAAICAQLVGIRGASGKKPVPCP